LYFLGFLFSLETLLIQFIFLLMLISSDIEDLLKGLFIISSFSPTVTCQVSTV